jgi:hypothetical protein
MLQTNCQLWVRQYTIALSLNDMGLTMIKRTGTSISLIILFSIMVSSMSPLTAGNDERLRFRPLETLAPIPASTTAIQTNDIKLVERIIHAYRLIAKKHEERGNSMWQTIFNKKHKPIHHAFLYGEPEAAAEILRNPGSSDLFWGIDNLASSLAYLFRDPDSARDHAASCLDGLVRFAEVIGAIRLENPEGIRLEPKPWEAESIIKKIELSLGQQIDFPNPYPNEQGFYTSKGIVSYRAPQGLYQAWRIKQLVKGIKNPRVLEIGGGVGRTAYYARLLGIKDYTIVDLPFTGTISAYFLGRTVGEDQILLAGETGSDPSQRIKILPPEAFLDSHESYDLIINVDSLTEMDPNVAKAYWKKIEASTKIFLSINHETNSFTVKQLIDSSARVAQADRFPYWMRHGYVEEIVRLIH